MNSIGSTFPLLLGPQIPVPLLVLLMLIRDGEFGPSELLLILERKINKMQPKAVKRLKKSGVLDSKDKNGFWRA